MDLDIDKKKTVIVADDDDIVLSHMSVLLEKLGFTDVRTALDGQKALIILLNTATSLVITDLDMPLMNGLQLVHQIRRKNLYNSIPVIALTANDTKEMVIKALKTGVDAYLIKGSITEQELAFKINDAIQRRIQILNKSKKKPQT